MKAYKAFNKDLTCRGFQYEIGKTYEMKKEPIICDRGFHACTKFDDVFNYYDYGKETRICEVELLGDVDEDAQMDSKVATNKIKIVREVTTKDLLQLGTVGAITHLASTGYRSIPKEVIQNLTVDGRIEIAKYGSNRYRNVLANDPNSAVRRAIATNGTNKHRDILINDEDDGVRLRVAMYGTGRHHDILVSDKSSRVRRSVAINGTNKHRDILVTDEDATVRYEVVLWGNTRHRDVLVADVNSGVREAVARNGNHGHRDILINDSDNDVRRMVAIYGNDKHRNILSYDKDDDVRSIESHRM